MITLKTLKDATAQQVFDQVARHLLAQGKKAQRPHPERSEEVCCGYRSADGCVCAAGCLIGPDEYKKEWEGKSWRALAYSYGVGVTHAELIARLQQVHDWSVPALWKDELIRVASDFSLNTNVLEQ